MNQTIKFICLALIITIFPGFGSCQIVKEIKRFKVKAAQQGVAVDKDYFYVINNSSIVKHRKDDGREVSQWDGAAEGIRLKGQSTKVPVPTISGAWWPIAKNPDLGKYNSPEQQPVDFGVWQAEDGTWQLWSCIRNSKFPGTIYTTRFLYGWEGKSLTSTNWQPKGIKWVADSTLGETPGGMQAPFVLKEGDSYYLFYGDWNRICLARSSDGKNFERVLGKNGQPDLFTEYADLEYGRNARDPMVLKKGNTFYCFYTSHLREPGEDGAAFCRISFNLMEWSESSMVARTTPYRGNSQRYSDECPFVVYLPEYKLYYLFVTQLYGKNNQTTVYASPNPMYFGVNDARRKVCTLPIAAPEIVYHDGKYYLVALNPALDGIRMANLEWRVK